MRWGCTELTLCSALLPAPLALHTPQTLPLHPQNGGPEAWLDLGSCFYHGPRQSLSQLYTEKELEELVR